MTPAFRTSSENTISRRRALASLAAGLGSLAAGCGVGEYETRMAESIEFMELENKFVYLQPNETIVNGPDSPFAPVSIRLPVMLPASRTAPPLLLVEGCTMPEDQNRPMPEERLKPPKPLPEIPGFQVSMEKYIPTGAGNRPCYMYVGMENAGTGPATRQRLLETTVNALTADGQSQTTQNLGWIRESLPTPPPERGTILPPISVDVLTIECQQLFEVRGNVANKVPGVFKLMSYETAGQVIYLGWRIPVAAYDRQDFFLAADAAMGTIRIAGGRAAPAKT